MKKQFHSYFHFTRTERLGVYSLLVLIFILGAIRLSLRYWVVPNHDKEKEKQLIAAWTRYKLLLTTEKDKPEQYLATRESFPFDPNSLDSSGFVSLGLRPRTVHLLLNWRRKGKRFYRPDDLKHLYTLTETEFRRLEPLIRIKREKEPNRERAWQNDDKPMPALVDLNTADSALLVRLNGIGPVLSHKIVERRNALGGFISHQQLNEIYRFPDSTFKMLNQRLSITPGSIRKLSLNHASLETLKNHPYIGEKMAKNIILFREGVKQFENIDQLRQVPLMNEENYRKIAPYFTLE